MRPLPGPLVLWMAWVAADPTTSGATFALPTNNRALFEPGGEERFFAPTAGKTWTAGQFGCVRSAGQQFHEGIDILCTERDRHDEPTDPVRAIADGTIAYINRSPDLSTYGNYLVVRHAIEGIEVCSLYAHLRNVRSDLAAGVRVKQGEALGTLGRTTNTRSPITRDRAHVHLEIVLFVNDRFPAWLKARDPGARDEHGAWNGRNLLGLDPAELFRQQARLGERFSLRDFLRSQTAMCRVLVAKTDFPWLRRYPMLIRRNRRAEQEGAAAYELALNFNGVPFQAVPRAASEVRPPPTPQVLEVNEAEYRRHPCRQLIARKGQSWVLTVNGQQLIDLLTY